MRDSIRSQDPNAGEGGCIREGGEDNDVAPLTPMVVFINPRSGGRHGPDLMERLQDLMSDEQVTCLILTIPSLIFRLLLLLLSRDNSLSAEFDCWVVIDIIVSVFVLI